MPKGKCLEGCNQMSWTENNVSARYFGGEGKKVLLQQKTSILKIRKDVMIGDLLDIVSSHFDKKIMAEALIISSV